MVSSVIDVYAATVVSSGVEWMYSIVCMWLKLVVVAKDIRISSDKGVTPFD